MIRLPKRFLVPLCLSALFCGASGLPLARADDKKPDETADPLPAGARLRLGTGRFHHGAAVTRIIALPDGKRLLTIAQDMKARVWDIETAKKLVEIALAPNGRFSNLAYSVSPDGKTLAAANGLDNTIRIFTLADGKESLVFTALPVAQGLLDLEYSADGKKLVSSHRDRTYRIWDVATAKELRTISHPGPTNVAGLFNGRVRFLPDGKALAIVEDWAVRVLDAEDGKELRWFGGHTAQVQALAFSPDGKQMATVAFDRAARLWDIATGKTIAKLPLPLGAGRDLAFSADGKILAIAGGDRLVRLFDVAAAKQVAQIDLGAATVIPSFALSPDGKSLYVSSNESVLHGYDTATGKELFPTTGHVGAVQALAWSADGKFVATSGQSDQSILLWDTASGKLIRRWSGAEPISFTQLQFTPDGKTLLGYGFDRTVRSWDVAEGKERSSFVVAPVQPNSLAFSHDGKLAAVLANDRKILIWDIAAEKELHQFEVKPTAPATGFFAAYLFFSGDNRTLVAYSSSERSVRRWDAVAGKELSETKPVNLPFGVAVSTAGDGWGSLHYQGAAINLIEVSTGKPRLTLTMPAAPPVPGAPPQFVTTTGAALSRDGRTIATLTAAGRLFFWDTGSAKVLIERKSVPVGTRHVAFAPDGKTVATAGNDGGVMLWEVPGATAEGRLVAKELTAEAVTKLWNDLSGDDPRAAWQAILTLAAAPKESLPLVQKQLKPGSAPDEKQIAQWIKALDAESFQEREEASEALARAGRAAEGAVRKALGNPPSAEAKQRMNSILAKLSGKQGPNLEEVRTLRAVELLEKIGTAEAQKALEEVAKGSDEAAIAAARAALARIKMP